MEETTFYPWWHRIIQLGYITTNRKTESPSATLQTSSALSKQLSVSLAYLQLQLGTNVCPLDLDYEQWGYFVPLSWIKMLWQTLEVSSFELHLEFYVILLPRRGDRVMMELIMEHIKNQDQLKTLARVRGFLNIIFLSDIVTTYGKFIE